MNQRRLTQKDTAIVQSAAKEMSQKYGISPIKASLDEFKTGIPMGYFDEDGKLVAWRVLHPVTGEIISGIGETEESKSAFSNSTDDEDDLDSIAEDLGLEEDDLNEMENDFIVADPDLASLVQNNNHFEDFYEYEKPPQTHSMSHQHETYDEMDRFDRAVMRQNRNAIDDDFVEKHAQAARQDTKEKKNPAVVAVVAITTIAILAALGFGIYKGVMAIMDRVFPHEEAQTSSINYDEYNQIEPNAITHVNIEAGSSPADIEIALCESGVPNVARNFIEVVEETESGELLQANDYIVRGDEDAYSVVARMSEGDRVPDGVIGINEGDTLDTIIEAVRNSNVRFDMEAFNAEMHSPYFFAGEFSMLTQLPEGLTTLEGYFRTGEYNLYWCESQHDAIRCLLSPMQERFEQSGMTPLDWFNVLNKASMVEKEALFHEDRPRIAAVIENRLREGMELQIDATVQYATGNYDPHVLYDLLDVDSPYNTYKIFGLPLGPICSGISEESINAVLNPDMGDIDGNTLYYVLSDVEGHHVFTNDLDEFAGMKQHYLELYGLAE